MSLIVDDDYSLLTAKRENTGTIHLVEWVKCSDNNDYPCLCCGGCRHESANGSLAGGLLANYLWNLPKLLSRKGVLQSKSRKSSPTG